jgi:hypothetical protein
MTIHWKALEEHFLMITLEPVFQLNHSKGNTHFLNFSKKKVLKELIQTKKWKESSNIGGLFMEHITSSGRRLPSNK